ncbi:MAG: ATP-dependent helicase [Acidimicrobiaceae bacterium]|nr:ATP-dependent helicase [Acidimicrobiaceae bacterium]
MTGDDHPLLAGLSAEQREAVTTRASPLCLIAGAGSGKTRVLTRRIAWHADQGHIDPRRTLAVTFTRRAARELRSRLRQLGAAGAVKAGTFHSVALAQLRRHAADSDRRPPQILDNPAKLIAELHPSSGRRTRNDIIAEISWCRARLVTAGDYPAAAKAAGRRAPLGRYECFAGTFGDYQAAKRKRRVLDFDDVLARATEMMESLPQHAAAQRWLHRHLLVDEFQDINPLQFRLLKSWLGPDSTLLVVGDPDQAIYGWNGADPKLIDSVAEHFPGCAVMHMRTNFRSTPEVLTAASRVLGRAPQPAVRPPGGDPTITVCDGAEEAEVLARLIRRRHRPGSRWRRQAVLARTNSQLEPLRQALLQRNIPVVTTGETGLLRRPEIAAVRESWTDNARLASCVADTRQWLQEASGDGGGASDDGHNAAFGIGNGPGSSGHTPATRADTPAARADVKAFIEAFLDFAEDHLSLDPDATAGAFLTSLRADDRALGRGDGVDLTTFHGAKGQEWPIVYLVGLEDGYVPIHHARTAEARAEERRLLHVAVTRAQQELHLLWCDQRHNGDKTFLKAPSPWVEAISEGFSGATGQADNVAAVGRAREMLRAKRDEQR